MKIFKTLILQILIVFCSFLSTNSSAQVQWHANPDVSKKETDWFRRLDNDGTSTAFNCNPNKKEGSVSVQPDASRGDVWRIIKPVDNQRSELARTEGNRSDGNYNHPEGTARYYGWSWKIDINKPIENDDFITVWQWKTNKTGSQNYPLNMEYFKDKLKLEAFGPCIKNGQLKPSADCGFPSQRKVTLAEVTVKENQWVDLVVRIKKDDNENEGFVEFWVNGVKQTLRNGSPTGSFRVNFKNGDNKRAFFRTSDGDINTSQNVYPKWGAYNRFACKYRTTTYYDEMRIANTFSQANPATYNGSSGGNSSSTFTGTKNLKRGTRYLQTNGTSLTSSTTNTQDSRKFTFISRGNNEYNINPKTKGLLQMLLINGSWRVRTSDRETGSSIGRYLWKAESVGGGKYRFKNKASNRYLTIWNSGSVGSTTSSSNSAAQFNIVNTGAKQAESKKLGDEEIVNTISIYPNPVHDRFTIVLNDIEKPLITITNMLGKVIYKKYASSSILELSKNDGFSSGIYFLSVTDAKQNTLHKKFVVK